MPSLSKDAHDILNYLRRHRGSPGYCFPDVMRFHLAWSVEEAGEFDTLLETLLCAALIRRHNEGWYRLTRQGRRALEVSKPRGDQIHITNSRFGPGSVVGAGQVHADYLAGRDISRQTLPTPAHRKPTEPSGRTQRAKFKTRPHRPG